LLASIVSGPQAGHRRGIAAAPAAGPLAARRRAAPSTWISSRVIATPPLPGPASRPGGHPASAGWVGFAPASWGVRPVDEANREMVAGRAAESEGLPRVRGQGTSPCPTAAMGGRLGSTASRFRPRTWRTAPVIARGPLGDDRADALAAAELVTEGDRAGAS